MKKYACWVAFRAVIGLVVVACGGAEPAPTLGPISPATAIPATSIFAGQTSMGGRCGYSHPYDAAHACAVRHAPDACPNTSSNVNADAHGYAPAIAHARADRVTYADAGPHSNANAQPGVFSHGHPWAHSDAHSWAYLDAHSNTDAYTHPPRPPFPSTPGMEWRFGAFHVNGFRVSPGRP